MLKRWYLVMSELVNKVAEILKAPIDLVQRSAEARAAASGKSVDEVLSSWAGGESVEASAPVEAEPVAEAPVEEIVQEVVEEVVDMKKESSLAFISGVLSIAVFTFIFAFLTPKNQSISIVESSLNNTISVSADVIEGAEIYSELNCQSCHTQNVRTLIPDTQNGKVLSNKYANKALIKNIGNIRLGPDLSTNSLREPTNNAQWLGRYLTDSSSVNREIPHPNYEFLNDQDLDYLITYLLSLGESNE